ncbi:hypothetical protein TNCV_4590701 [Trichonephila clavipes]|nr:hypothetical protein TNCV_4590701 [Trichonephila clavipes]
MRITILTRHDPIRERSLSSHQVFKTNRNLELFRKFRSTNQQLDTHQHDSITVAPHLLIRIWDGGSLREPYAKMGHRRHNPF